MTTKHAAVGEFSALIDCLEAEYRALLAEDIGQLHAVLARKQQLLADLATRPAATGAPYGNGGEFAAPLKRTVAHLRELNRRNALVLAPRSALIRARLRFLQAAVGRDSVYAADGSLTSGSFRAAYPQSV